MSENRLIVCDVCGYSHVKSDIDLYRWAQIQIMLRGNQHDLSFPVAIDICRNCVEKDNHRWLNALIGVYESRAETDADRVHALAELFEQDRIEATESMLSGQGAAVG